MLMIPIGHHVGKARWSGIYECQAGVGNKPHLAGFRSKPWHSLIVREASGRFSNLTKSISVIYKVVMIVQTTENIHRIFRLLNSMLIRVFYLIQQPIYPSHHDSPFYNDVGMNQNRICKAVGCVPGIYLMSLPYAIILRTTDYSLALFSQVLIWGQVIVWAPFCVPMALWGRSPRVQKGCWAHCIIMPMRSSLWLLWNLVFCVPVAAGQLMRRTTLSMWTTEAASPDESGSQSLSLLMCK